MQGVTIKHIGRMMSQQQPHKRWHQKEKEKLKTRRPVATEFCFAHGKKGTYELKFTGAIQYNWTVIYIIKM